MKRRAKRTAKFRTMLRASSRGRGALYAIRNADGTFADIESVSRASRVERRRHAKTVVKPGYGFRGDTKKTKRKRKR